MIYQQHNHSYYDMTRDRAGGGAAPPPHVLYFKKKSVGGINAQPLHYFFFFNAILTIQYETPLTLITMLIYITLLTVTNNYTTYN